jgi:hypothetical protein
MIASASSWSKGSGSGLVREGVDARRGVGEHHAVGDRELMAWRSTLILLLRVLPVQSGSVASAVRMSLRTRRAPAARRSSPSTSPARRGSP